MTTSKKCSWFNTYLFSMHDNEFKQIAKATLRSKFLIALNGRQSSRSYQHSLGRRVNKWDFC